MTPTLRGMVRRAGFSLTAALALWAGSAGADPLPFEGKWIREGEACAGGQATPLVLNAKRLDATGLMSCDFTSVLPGGIAFRVEADCESGGHMGHEFFTFAVLSGRLYWGWDGQSKTFERCAN